MLSYHRIKELLSGTWQWGVVICSVYLKKGNNTTKRLAYTALVRPTLEYGAVCWDPYRGHVRLLNRVQKRAAKVANNINESVWETLAQRRLIARICAICKAYTGRWAWKALGNRLLKPYIWVGMIIIEKLGLGNKEQMLVNVSS